MSKTKKYSKKFGGMPTMEQLQSTFGPPTPVNNNVNINRLTDHIRPTHPRRLEAEDAESDTKRILEIVNRNMPTELTNMGINAENVQRSNSMLFVTLTGVLYGLTNIHISFVNRNKDILHITANIPSSWVSRNFEQNPVIHIYWNGTVGFQSETADRAQFITPRHTGISTSRLVAGLSQHNGPNIDNALVRRQATTHAPGRPGVLVDDLIRIFGSPNNPGRLPLGRQGEGGPLTHIELHNIFRLFRNLLWAVGRDAEIQQLVDNIFNHTGQRGRLRGGLKTKKQRRRKRKKTKGRSKKNLK